MTPFFAILLAIPLAIAMIAAVATTMMFGLTTIAIAVVLPVAAIPVVILLAFFISVSKPSTALGGIAVCCATAAVSTAFVGLFSAFLVGWVNIDARTSELQAIEKSTFAIEIADRTNRPIGIYPVAEPATSYFAVPLRAEDVPAPYYNCLSYLEDRHPDAGVFGVDLAAFARAAVLNLNPLRLSGHTKTARFGASGFREMIVRQLLNEIPHPHASALAELERKFRSWVALPAMSKALFPSEAALKAGVATHLPHFVGMPNSDFSGETHGLVASAIVLGKSWRDLDTAELLFLAGAVNLPPHIGTREQIEKSAVARNSWATAANRALMCVAAMPDGTFAHGESRASVRAEIGALANRWRQYDDTNVPINPVAMGFAAVNQAHSLKRYVAQEFGSNWRDDIREILIDHSPSLALRNAMAAAALTAESKAPGLSVPLWRGDGSAFVWGEVVKGQGQIVASVTNNAMDLANIPIPIGSVGKICAAIALGREHSADAGAIWAFAHSNGPAVQERLRSVPDNRIRQVFEAMNWPLPSDQAAWKNAVDGAVEITPARVLVAVKTLTKALFEQPMSSLESVDQSVIAVVDSAGHDHIVGPLTTLRTGALSSELTPATKVYVRTVLRGPISQGTMSRLAPTFAKYAVSSYWGKSGTADASERVANEDAPTRALWQVGGFQYQGQVYAFVLVVVSRDALHPLGHVQSPALSEMTNVLLTTALNRVEVADVR